MKIAFMHYHLKPGGVTTVLNHQVKAVSSFGESLLITGELPGDHIYKDAVTLPGIAYDTVKSRAFDPHQVAADILSAINFRWRDGCDLIHVHNPTLAKNRDFLIILKELQKKGCQLLLQIHDFAEDGRPGMYFSEPYLEDCHYGVINTRDYRYLLSSGLKPEGLHLIPNAIISESPLFGGIIEEDFVLYPVRAIRRKNVGEAILTSLFFPEDLALWITLPPNSPVDVESYQFWRDFCTKHNLNVRFGAGLDEELPDMLSSSQFILTTSIMEGFGFVFIEPWQAGKIIQGRYLDEICPDFEALGISFSHLYTNLPIPGKWIDRIEFSEEWLETIQSVSGSYGINFHQNRLQKSYEEMRSREFLDFGLLNEKFQSRILERLITDAKSRKELMTINPFLMNLQEPEISKEMIKSNRDLIRRSFTESAFSSSLLSVYRKVINKPVQQQIDKEILVSRFMHPDRFSLLKWGKFNG